MASIDTGFCPSTFFAGSPLYIEDAAESPFADHPARIELGFNGYAGFPLRDAEGQVIGTLCALDTRPHRWRRVDRLALGALANSVINEMALHQDIDRRQRLLDAFTAAPAAYEALFGALPLEVPPVRPCRRCRMSPYKLMNQVLASGAEYRSAEAPVTMLWSGEHAAART